MPTAMSDEMEKFDRNSSKYMFICDMVHCTTLLHILVWFIYIVCAFMFYDVIRVALDYINMPVNNFISLIVELIILLSLAFLMHVAWITENWKYMIPVVALEASIVVLYLFATLDFLLVILVGHLVSLFGMNVAPATLFLPVVALFVISIKGNIHVVSLAILMACMEYYSDKRADGKTGKTASSNCSSAKNTDKVAQKNTRGVYADVK